MATKRKPGRRKAAAAPRRVTRGAMAAGRKPTTRRRRKSSGSGKVDIMNVIIMPAAGFVIGSLAAKFVSQAASMDVLKPIVPAAGAYISAMYLKQPWLAAGMAAAAANEGVKMANIPLLSDMMSTQGGQFPLAADFTRLPILADGTMVQDSFGNYLTLSDGELYSTNPEAGSYTQNQSFL